MKKNWIALAVTLSISASMAGAFAAQNFSDVKSSWAQSQIDKAVSQNIMTGYNDGMFHPDAWISRQDFVQMAGKTLGLGADQSTIVPSFNSVAQNAYGFGPVDNQAWISSYPSGVTQPDNPVRRVEALSALAGALNKPLVSSDDADKILSKYQDASLIPVASRVDVATAIQYKLFEVDPKSGKDVIDPLRPVTRAEAAAMLDDLSNKKDIAIVQKGQLVANATPNGAGVPSQSIGSNAPSSIQPSGQVGESVASSSANPAAPSAATASQSSSVSGDNAAATAGAATGAAAGQSVASQDSAAQAPQQTTTGTSAVSGSNESNTGTNTTTGETTPSTGASTTGTEANPSTTSTSTTAENAGEQSGAAKEASKVGYNQLDTGKNWFLHNAIPFRSSADNIQLFREMNTSPAPSTMDASVPVTLAPNTTFMGTVAKALYSDFNRPGDPAMLILDHPVLDANGRIVAPAGSKVIGFVNNVISRNVSTENAQIGLTFNGFITPDGQVIPIKATINNADGILKAGQLQGLVYNPADRSVQGLRREIHTSAGSLYGSTDGKAAVLDQPPVKQLSSQPVDPMDISSKDLLIGVGDRIQVRLDSAGPGTSLDKVKMPPINERGGVTY